jgi:hypothetical protein
MLVEVLFQYDHWWLQYISMASIWHHLHKKDGRHCVVDVNFWTEKGSNSKTQWTLANNNSYATTINFKNTELYTNYLAYFVAAETLYHLCQLTTLEKIWDFFTFSLLFSEVIVKLACNFMGKRENLLTFLFWQMITKLFDA